MAVSKKLGKCINMTPIRKISFTKLNLEREIVEVTTQDFPHYINAKSYFKNQAKPWVSAEEKDEHRVIALTNADGSKLYYMAYMTKTMFGKKFVVDERNYG